MKTKTLLTILVGSVAQLVHAVPYNSVQSGNWSDINSWDIGGAFPDVYGNADNANIVGGNVIDFDDTTGGQVGSLSTPQSPVFAAVGATPPAGTGGLAVSNGNTVLIDGAGSMLTQSTLQTEIRIGEETGGGGNAGPGVMTISGGGVFNSGAALGVGIGTSFGPGAGGSGAGGNGLVNVVGGSSFVMGVGSGTPFAPGFPTGGLGVGIDGSTGVLNLGDTTGAANSNVLDLSTNNVQMGIGVGFLAGIGGTGTVTVNTDGQINIGNQDITVGNDGGVATLNVNGGVTAGVGQAGGGNLIVGDGAVGATQTQGTLNIGTGAAIAGFNELRVGSNGGNGILSMTDGSVSAQSINIANGTGATATATVSGGTISAGGNFIVGFNGGDAAMTMSGGAITTVGQFLVGSNAGSTGSLVVTGGSIAAGSQFIVGQNTSVMATASVSNATITSGGETQIGEGNGAGVPALGTLNIHAGTNWTATGEFQDGNDGGVGVVNMDGGTLNLNSWFSVGRTGGTGTFNFSGGLITMPDNVNKDFSIASFNPGGLPSTGTFNQTGGDIVLIGSNPPTAYVARDASDVGVWNMSAGTFTGWDIVLANGAGSSGQMVVSGSANINTQGGWMYVGNGNGGTGELDQSGGVINNSAGRLMVGSNTDGNIGVVNQTGGDHQMGALYIGSNGGINRSGVVNISAGTIEDGGWTEIGGSDPTNTGTLNISGAGVVSLSSVAGANQDANVGINGGVGTINIISGGTLNVGWWLNIGRGGASPGGVDTPGTGTVLLDGVGSTINQNTGRLNVGGDASQANGTLAQYGSGTLTVQNGGVITRNNTDIITVGYGTDVTGAPSTGVLTLTDPGTLLQNNAGELFVGMNGGTGVLNIANGATFNQNGYVNIGRNAGTGTVNQSGGTFAVTNGQIRVGAQFGETPGNGTYNLLGGDVSTTNEFIVGEGAGSIGTMTQSGGTVTSGGEYQDGNDGGTGTVTQTGGTLTLHSYFSAGRNGGTGTYNLFGGQIIAPANSGDFSVGSWSQNGTQPANGTFNQTGGDIILQTLTAGNPNPETAYVDRDPGDTGVWNMSGGTFTGWDIVVANAGPVNGLGGTGVFNISDTANINTQGGWFYVGQGDGAVGTMNQTGGTINNNGGWFSIASNADRATGIVNQSGGDHTMNRLMMASNGGVNRTATYNLTGGTFENSGWTEIGGGNSTNVATLNISGTGVATFNGGQDANVGINGGVGFLNITGGGTMNMNWWLNFGRTQGGQPSGAVGTGLVDGVGSTFTQTGGRLNIGGGDDGNTDIGTGTFTISNGGVVTRTGTDIITVGNQVGSIGTLTITDPGSLLENDGGEIYIGVASGTGTMNIVNGATVNHNSNIQVGRNGGVGTLNQDSGVFNVANQIRIGANYGAETGGTGTYNLTGGSVTSGNEFIIGEGGLSTGTMYLSGTGSVTANGEVQVGNDDGTGILNMSGGTILSNSWFGLGRNGGNGTLNLSGGTITKGAVSGTFDIGVFGDANIPNSVGTGVLNQTGGSIINTVSDTNIARDRDDVNMTSSSGQWNMSGGTATLATLNVGNNGVGTLVQTGGNISASGGVFVARNGGSTGTLALAGGTLATTFIQAGGGTVALDMNGGTMQALADQPDFLQGFNASNSLVDNGGAIFDTNGFTVAVNSVLAGPGAVTKNGDGDLSVTNSANAYTGGTVVNRGNLIFPVISAAGSLGVNVAINGPGAAALDGGDLNPLLAQVITTSNGAIALHASDSTADLDLSNYPNLSLGSVGDQTFSNVLTIAPGNSYRLGGGGGTLTFTPAMGDVGGPTNLIVDGNGLVGNVTLTSVSTYTGSTSIGSGTLTLSAGANTLPVNTALTVNAGGTLDLNGNNQQVGSLTGASSALVTSNVGPATFTTGSDNTSTVYDGQIGGPISLVKIGTGTQTLSAAQSYTSLAVNGGGVVLGGTNILGTQALNNGSLTLAANTSLTLTAHTGGPSNVKTLVVNGTGPSSLSIASNAHLDLTNNAAIFHGTTQAAVNALLFSGQYSGPNGYWDGPGINSSSAANDPNGITALGIIDNAEFGFTSFAGVNNLDGTEILVKYTYFGDTDLNGVVNVSDFSQFVVGLTHQGPAEWLNGDFDNNGVVNVVDFSLFVDGLVGQTGQLRPGDTALVTQEIDQMAAQVGIDPGSLGSAADASGGADAGRAVVPEPGSIGLLAVGALGLLARRRRSNSPQQ